MDRLQQFYKSDEWERLRSRLIIERTDSDGLLICERCGKPILKRYDCVAHHKQELTEENVKDYSVSLNPDNIELIHFKCHNRLHQRYDGFRQEVYLVWGSPCAGKTTWVNNNAYADDLILDIDRIWESICNSDRLHKPNRLKANVFGIRDAVIDQVRMRKGMWRNAYIIGTYPSETDRARMCDLLGAKEIYIEATKDECLERAPSDEWKQYIEDWFAEVTPSP